MNIPKELKYVKTHEWVLITDEGTAKVGITDHAQEELGDLVFVELPEEGDSFSAGENFAVVESVKATSDVVMPVGGTVAAVNAEVMDSPEKVNEDSYAAWFVELKDVELPDDLMSAEEYEAFLKSE